MSLASSFCLKLRIMARTVTYGVSGIKAVGSMENDDSIQALDANSLQFELKRIEQELLKEMPSDFWDDV